MANYWYQEFQKELFNSVWYLLQIYSMDNYIPALLQNTQLFYNSNQYFYAYNQYI